MVVKQNDFVGIEREVLAQECIDCGKYDDVGYYDDVDEVCSRCGSDEVVAIHNSDGEDCGHCGNPLEYDDEYFMHEQSGECICEHCYNELDE